MAEPRRFLQVLAGPRQVGKTTLATQAAATFGGKTLYASADGVLLHDPSWIEAQWERIRGTARERGEPVLLVLDEVQKIRNWSEAVKRNWDADTLSRLDVRVLLLGSSPLLLQQGLTESLAGRFELVRATQWTYREMREAFGWDFERYLRFGGYPAAAALSDDPERWTLHILDSLVETALSRDVLLMTRVDKPALLRRLFELGCAYSGQILSYQKMIGQLQDVGNVATVAHYLDLLSGAGLVTGLQKYAGSGVRQRASSPKLLALDTGLVSAVMRRTAEAPDSAWRGRLVETVVGAHLSHAAAESTMEVFYWNEGQREVDFVVRRGEHVLAIEVKSGRRPPRLGSLDAFAKAHPSARRLVVGGTGVPVEEFLERSPNEWMG